jgi:hypothetical protein
MARLLVVAAGVVALCGAILCASHAAEPGAAKPFPAGSVKFVMHRIGTFRSEGCGVADFNKDGKLDVVAGSYLYLAPDWKPLFIHPTQSDVKEDGKGYNWDFMDAPVDVDGDGLVDVVSCSWFTKRLEWYRNTGPGGGEWPLAIADENGNYECGDLWDIDGDGKALEILPHTTKTMWYEVGKGPDGKRKIIKHVVSEKDMDFGGGVGDVNGDGRPDILRPNAWFEAPADPRKGKWIEHPIALGGRNGKVEHTPQIWVYDVNGDGLADIITSSAHGYGIFWYEQVRTGGQISFKQHVIDDTWTQAHAITLADLDHDGDLDLVTGKRFMAHNGSDPEEDAPLGVYWYELVHGPSPKWVKHVISYSQGIGAGMNIPVVDLDGDGDLDIVVTGKWGGPVWFENKAK